MFDFYEKRKLRNVLYSKFTIGVLVVVTLLFMYSVWGAYSKEVDTRMTKEKREEVLTELEEREEILGKEIDRLNTQRGIEAEIRSKFEVAKEGEEVIVIVDAPEEEVEVVVEEKKGFWSRLFGL